MTDLTAPYGPLAYFLDLHPDLGDFRADAINGLSAPQKWMSPKYFYDDVGSKIFDEITTLDTYYPTRTEKSVFLQYAPQIAESVGTNAAIFEYGSGSSEKIEWLVNSLDDPVAYVAMDISKDHLLTSAAALTQTLTIPIAAICADFHAPVTLPADILPSPASWLGYFPGSTIGNMLPKNAIAFLNRASTTLGANSKFLIGVDLEKDRNVLEAAYDDKGGVTAAFNLNLLRRMKHELDAAITLDDFEHFAFYNEEKWRVEMHLRAIRPTTILVDGHQFNFAAGETLHTENSHKYSIEGIKRLLEPTPWKLEQAWTDPKGWYAACLLSNS